MMDRNERLCHRIPVSQFRERVIAFTRTAALLFITVLVALDFVTPMFAQTPGPGAPGLPMAEVRACAIEYRSAVALQGQWGGQIALYDATTDPHGVAVVFKRRIIDGREHLPPLVRLEQIE